MTSTLCSNFFLLRFLCSYFSSSILVAKLISITSVSLRPKKKSHKKLNNFNRSFLISPILAVYNEAGKSPPTRDKLQPENKAQVRSGRGNRDTDATGKFLLFLLNFFLLYCFQFMLCRHNFCFCLFLFRSSSSIVRALISAFIEGIKFQHSTFLALP